ncbi:MAG: hypothetical protein WEG36_16245 [Gemmatimonadota bacterium]
MAKKSEGKGRRQRRAETAPGSRTAGRAPSGGLDSANLDRIPRWLPFALFAALTVFLFREFIFSDRMMYGEDTLTLGYMARDFFANALRTTGFPLWNPVILGGTPFLDALSGGDSLYPPSLLLLLVMETYRALGWKLVLHVFLAGSFMYLWLRVLRVSRSGALLGGVAYLLAPYFVTLIFPGHDGKIFVTALTPLLFCACEWSWVRRDLVPLAAIGGVVALVLLTTHFQMAYFLFGATGAYMAFRTVQFWRSDGAGEGKRALRHFGSFLGFSVLGAGAAGIQLIPAVDYVVESSRRTATTVAAEGETGIEYSSSWSLHPEEALSLVVPEFVGNTRAGAAWSLNTYWGRNAFKLNHEYLGLVALLLAAVAMIGRGAGGTRWFMAGMGGVALLFALGTHTPIWRLFYEVLPGVSLFRAPSIAIFLTGFATATLAAIGFDHGIGLVARGEGGRVLRVLGVGAGALALGSALAASGALESVWDFVFSPELNDVQIQARARAEPFIVRGFFIATLLATLVLLTWVGVTRGLLKGTFAVALLALLVTVDQLRVDEAFVQTLDFAAFSSPDPNLAFLMDRADFEPPFRVFSMIQGGQDVSPGMYGLDLAAGHHPNDLARYRELIGMEGSGIPENLAYFHPNVMRILNVRYVIWPDGQIGPIEDVDPLNQLVLPDGTVFSSVYPYPGLPRARIVGDAVVVPEAEGVAVILGNHELEYDPFRQAVLNEEPTFELGGPEVRGNAQWVERTPNRLLLEVESSGPGLLVLSENWFPAWRATVDGEEVPVLRADHTLRGVPIPGGAHRVEMWYESSVLRGALGVSLVSLFALLGVAIAGVAWRRRPVAGEGKEPG